MRQRSSGQSLCLSISRGRRAIQKLAGWLTAALRGRRRPARRRNWRSGDEAWLIGERRATGEHKYYLSNLPTDTPITVLASTTKARWICEQAHQQLKEELGLDHFEGRSWHGL